MKEEGLVKNLEDFLTFIRDESSECSLKEIAVEGFLHSVHVIGFHHKQGSIVEFSYPDNSKNELLAYLALPDCVHNTNVTKK
jgi:hypothetical protein